MALKNFVVAGNQLHKISLAHPYNKPALEMQFLCPTPFHELPRSTVDSTSTSVKTWAAFFPLPAKRPAGRERRTEKMRLRFHRSRSISTFAIQKWRPARDLGRFQRPTTRSFSQNRFLTGGAGITSISGHRRTSKNILEIGGRVLTFVLKMPLSAGIFVITP